MTVAAAIGQDLDVTPPAVATKQAELLRAYELPENAIDAAPPEAVIGAIRHDKKAVAGETPWVLLEGLGRATPGHRVPAEVAERAIGAALVPS